MTQKDKADLTTEITTNFADNTSGEISAADMRGILGNIVDSYPNNIDNPAVTTAIAHTNNLLKGDNSGNGIAATPGTDYVLPSGLQAFALARGETYPHLYANSGDGSEGNPYTSTDGTGGIQAALNAFSTRGGRSTLATARFNATSTILLTKPATQLQGNSLGANVDPNGESHGVSGSEINFSGNSAGFAIQIQNAVGDTARMGGINIDNLYMFGAGKTGYAPTSAIKVIGSLDQPHFSNINVGKSGAAIRVDGNMDTPYINRVNALSCGYGLMSVNGAWLFAHVTDCCFSDLDYAGVLDGPSGLGGNNYTGLTLARCAGVGDQAIILRQTNNRVSNCVIFQTGVQYISGNHRTSGAHGILVGPSSNSNEIIGNRFEGNAYGSAIYLLSGTSNNLITSNTYSGNSVDITIEAGVSDTIINEPGKKLVISDAGTRTIINGTSVNAGNPNSTGQWNNVNKPQGLIIRDTTNNLNYFYYDNANGNTTI